MLALPGAPCLSDAHPRRVHGFSHGVPKAFDDPARLLALPQPWPVQDAPADYPARMLQAIVGIEIPVQRWVGKWKVSQNRPAPDRQGVVAGLMAQGSDAAAQMAALVGQRG